MKQYKVTLMLGGLRKYVHHKRLIFIGHPQLGLLSCFTAKRQVSELIVAAESTEALHRLEITEAFEEALASIQEALIAKSPPNERANQYLTL